MVARDIDAYVVRERWTSSRCWSALAPLFANERLQSTRLSKWCGRHRSPALPEAFSAVLRYYTDGGLQWRIDVWFFAPAVPAEQMALHAALIGGLTADVRAAILWIKDAVHAEPWYSSADLYRKVLHDGVRSPAAYRATVAAGLR